VNSIALNFGTGIGYRLGNQMSQYAFAKSYAEQHHCQLQTTPWIGQRIFQLDDSPLERPYPNRNDLKLEQWSGETNIAIVGYAQHQKHLIYSRAEALKWFTFRPEVLAQLSGVPHYKAAAHLRWGDFATTPGFIIISKESYLAACRQFGIDPSELHFISEENPLTVPDLDPGLSFLPDFYALIQADILLRAPSTFSWWAGVLGNHTRIFSPDQRGIPHSQPAPQRVPFVEGNHMPITAWWKGHSELNLRET
jgi:hypothetical protein